MLRVFLVEDESTIRETLRDAQILSNFVDDLEKVAQNFNPYLS